LARTAAFARPTPRPPAATVAHVRGSPPVAPPLGRTAFIFSTTLFTTDSARASLSPSGRYSFAIAARGASCFFACISRLVVYQRHISSSFLGVTALVIILRNSLISRSFPALVFEVFSPVTRRVPGVYMLTSKFSWCLLYSSLARPKSTAIGMLALALRARYSIVFRVFRVP